MSANYIIREATDADWQQILDIYRFYWDKHFENIPDDYEKVLRYLKEAFDKREGYFNFWVCDNGEGEIYGWQSCLPVFTSPLRRDYNGELSLFVRNDKRNGIIGTKLSNEVMKILENSPLYILYANIFTNNSSSKKLATNAGFRNTEILFINTPYYNEINLWMKPIKGEIITLTSSK